MRSPTTLLPLLVACAPFAGCTAIILNDASTADAPCEEPFDCASGQRCEGNVCVDDTRDAEAPEDPAIVGAEGGLLIGPDGLSIEIPPGALDTETTLTITRESSTTPLDGLEARSRFFRIAPAVSLDEAATITIDLDGTCADCAIFFEDGSAFVALPDTDGPAGAIAGLATRLGLVVAARETP